ncbi:MAG: ATP synthase F1 subunit gamma [Candidatus Neomarinimicrobiota bacterium]|nr:ATP synthase F1 subunit gamma [Candidatus Neomarinimicrobiota bacterium]RKY46755.1 MAG: ATP synthase F1 subunit gamma [Candidatus Neomarinimicrobiota bacterium]HDN58508.1 ATP synthase F1 subunit gamma [Candidatus Neomarinimicrobiota bacterium]
MSIALRKVKEKIDSIENIRGIIDAMYTISTIKIKKAQEALHKARKYSDRINTLFRDLLPHIDRNIHPLLAQREPKNRCYIVITSDHGLCGAFNSNIIATAEREFSKLNKDEIFLICVGRAGRDYFHYKGYNVIGEYIRFFDELGYQHALEVAEVVMDLFMLFEMDQAIVIYNEFKSMIRQNVIVKQYLPLVVKPTTAKVRSEMLFIPGRDEIVKHLVPQYLNVQMWEYLLESYAAEQAARMISMESAGKNAEDMIEKLRLSYNKIRQAEITSEIMDVIGGTNTLE